MKLRMKKADWLLVIMIFAVAATGYGVIWGIRSNRSKGHNLQAVISVDGEILASLVLTEDQSYHIPTPDGDSVLVIQDGKCYMQSAHCPDQICVKKHEISRYGESIICLPYKIVVSIDGDGVSDYDN